MIEYIAASAGGLASVFGVVARVWWKSKQASERNNAALNDRIKETNDKLVQLELDISEQYRSISERITRVEQDVKWMRDVLERKY